MIMGAWGLGRKRGWTNPYVTDGLVAMWDGEWNAGGGVHDAAATVWADLSGNGYDATVSIGTWEADGLNGGESVNQCWTVVSKSMAGADVAHVEFVLSGFRMATWATICHLGGRARCPTFNVNSRFEPTAGYLPFYNYPDLSTSHRIVDGVFAVDYNISKAWHNGTEMGVKEGSQYSIYPSNFIVAAGLVRNSSVSGYLNGGKICRLAAYSRSLTADEIAANYSVDKQRFNLP